MKPLEVAVEVSGGGASMAAQKVLEALMAAVDGLDVQRAPNMLAGCLIEHLVGDTELPGTRRKGGRAVCHQQGVLAEQRRQNGGHGIGADACQDNADRGAGAISGHQDGSPIPGASTSIAATVRPSSFCRM